MINRYQDHSDLGMLIITAYQQCFPGIVAAADRGVQDNGVCGECKSRLASEQLLTGG